MLYSLQIKSWVEQVFNNHRSEFETIFLNCLVNLRISNIVGTTSHSKLPKIPKGLLKLYKMYEASTEVDIEDFFEHSLTTGHILDILQDYSHAVMDLSLNELTIHSIIHSKVQVDSPYLKLESKVLKQTSLIYQQIDPIMHGKDVFENFFSLDCRIMAELFLNRTFCRFLNCAVDKQVSVIDDYLLTGAGLSSSSTRNGVMITSIQKTKIKGGICFESFEKLISVSNDKDSDISSPDTTLKLYRESLLQKILKEEICSEDDQIEDKIKKSSSCTSRKKTSENQPTTPSFIKKNKSKASLSKPESERKPLPGHDPELFEIFNELRSQLVQVFLTIGSSELKMSRKVLPNR